MMPDDLRHIATEVFQSIPPAVRTGVFIDVFTPCDWHHAARCMVDYAGIPDDPREPFAPACDMPVIRTTAVTEKTVISDVRPLAYPPDDASVYRLVVDMEMDCVEVGVEKDGIVYVENRPDTIGQAYADLADDLNDAVGESEKFALYDSLDAVHRFAYRLSEPTQRHLVLERSRTWRLMEWGSGSRLPHMRADIGGRYSTATNAFSCACANGSRCRTDWWSTRSPTDRTGYEGMSRRSVRASGVRTVRPMRRGCRNRRRRMGQSTSSHCMWPNTDRENCK